MLRFIFKMLASLGLIWTRVSPDAKQKVQKALSESLIAAYEKAQQLKSKAQDVWDSARRPTAKEVQSQMPPTKMSVSKILQQDLSAKEADKVAAEIEKYLSSLEFAEEVEENVAPASNGEREEVFNARVRAAVEKILKEKMK